MGTLIFIIVLSVLIIVHESGHFFTAKSLGVKVERFALGFGPKLLSRTIRGTEFILCLIPFGGYVKMAGDERDKCQGQPNEFYAKPPGHRALIISFGPIVNYLMAYICFFLVFLIGYPSLTSTVGESIKDYPAYEMGLQEGDQIIRIDSKEIQNWEDMQSYIRTSKSSSLDFGILRDGQEISKTITPRIEILENVFGQKEKIRVVGIRPKEEIVFIKYPVIQSLTKSLEKLYEITYMTYKALYRMATGAMSAKDSITGPIGIFIIIQKAAEMGFSYLVYIMAIISASLAIFNLLPLPILDGGHLFLLGIEKIRGKALSAKVDEVINRVGLSLIICLAVFVFYADIMRYGLVDKVVGFFRD